MDSGFVPSYTSSGTSWYDLSYNAYNGTLTNGPTFNSTNGGSIVFDGVDDYVNCGTNFTSSNYSYPFTTEIWVYVDATGNTTTNRGIFATSNSTTLSVYNGLSVGLGSSYNGSGNYKVFLNVGNGVSAGTTGRYSLTSNNEVLTGNAWNHIIATYNTGPTFTCYVNGVSVAGVTSGTGGALVWGTSKITTLGYSVGGYQYYFKGRVAIARVYNKLFSANDALQNYNSTKTRFGLS